ncbi:MAG: site-specific DNA-methyltransferase [Prevotella sp.]|nr:site-specific DNA-methyltransferase [Prevotella sp.]
MPTLNWIGKEKVVTHHLDVPFYTLEHRYGFRADDVSDTSKTGSGNMIIHGDNLIALKSLLPEYEGKIGCIYIDPPYNTGEENWMYNDNVNDPHIKKWLGEVVGREGEDLSRHDKWLCMMYPRLKILEKLLSKDGAIFISIKDQEFHNLKYICDKIFGISNFVGVLTWESSTQPINAGSAKFNLQKKCEFIFLYRKSGRKDFILKEEEEELDYPNEWKRGKCRFEIIEKSDAGGYKRDSMKFKILGRYPRKGKRWQIGEDTARELERNERVAIVDGLVKRVVYPEDELDKKKFEPFWSHFSSDFGTALTGKRLLNEIMGEAVGFDTVKPPCLIAKLISYLPKDVIVLDSYGGSSTTAHAVLLQNKKDGGSRRFIEIEMMDYADTLTAERTKRVMTGYPYQKKVKEKLYSKKLTLKNIAKASGWIDEACLVVEENRDLYDKVEGPVIKDNSIVVYGEKTNAEYMKGLGGAFDYYELGKPLFNPDNSLNEEVGEEDLRKYIFYSETKNPLERPREKTHQYLLDVYKNTAYYFYYEKGGLTVLNMDTLDIIRQRAEMYVVYADVCHLSEDFMVENHLLFKKIPRDIKRF